ncbi:hypothetical protein ACFQ88_36470 [Paenibacillus sp. NPDC056579]|uniref:hypothetical protein n=1 Tax=unclassified Paenibacillus TaxID=185978 RepID=UPI001EF76963|nr:hypothetical protein [Paenibacillus sp. H1-7]
MRVLFTLLICVAIAITAAGCGDAPNAKITKAKFEKLESGMTYEKATEIIGGEGELMAETGKKGEEMYIVTYQYKGDGLGSNAILVFQGGKLQVKSQNGLK